MLDGPFIHRDRGVFSAAAAAQRDDIVVKLREHLSPREAKFFGIDQPYDDIADAGLTQSPLLRGFAASLATVLLFVGVGMLSLPAAAFA